VPSVRVASAAALVSPSRAAAPTDPAGQACAYLLSRLAFEAGGAVVLTQMASSGWLDLFATQLYQMLSTGGSEAALKLVTCLITAVSARAGVSRAQVAAALAARASQVSASYFATHPAPSDFVVTAEPPSPPLDVSVTGPTVVPDVGPSAPTVVPDAPAPSMPPPPGWPSNIPWFPPTIIPTDPIVPGAPGAPAPGVPPHIIPTDPIVPGAIEEDEPPVGAPGFMSKALPFVGGAAVGFLGVVLIGRMMR
jgi:hypothetical protein